MTVRLLALRGAGYAALVAGDLEAAGRTAGAPLPDWFLDEAWLWSLRLDQVRADPASAPWLARPAVTADGVVVGHAGFHSRPDDAGAVEVGYAVVPALRGRGHGHALLAALLTEAASSAQVRLVRASVSPENPASLRVVTAAGFVPVGAQVDGADGRELVFERCLGGAGALGP